MLHGTALSPCAPNAATRRSSARAAATLPPAAKASSNQPAAAQAGSGASGSTRREVRPGMTRPVDRAPTRARRMEEVVKEAEAEQAGADGDAVDADRRATASAANRRSI